MSKTDQPWIERITNPSNDLWWRNCEIEEVKNPGRAPRWVLRDASKTYSTTMAPVAAACSGAAYMFSVSIQKMSEAMAPAALVRLSVKPQDDEQQFWDVTLDPVTGKNKVPAAPGHAFGQVKDNLDSWRVSVVAMVPPEMTADIQACLAPSIGPEPGVYAPGAKGEITVRDLKFRRLQIDEFLATSAEWGGAETV